MILPIVFFAAIYLTVYLVASPVLSSAASVAGLIFSDYEKVYSSEYNNIFVPFADESPISTVNVNGEELLDISEIEFPKTGEQFGELSVDECGISNVKLFFGDGNIPLKNGVGIYTGSHIPGYGSTVLVAGHNNTYFNGLKNAEAGQTVEIRTSYGNYTYEITKTAVKSASDTSAYDLYQDEENLIMYTCYPFDELGLTSKRFFVYAEYVSGPLIDTSVRED